MVSILCKLKEYRLAAGLTQGELAAKVGVRRETILRLEAGRYNPSLELAFHISEAVGAPIGDIFLLEKGRTDMEVIREYHFARRADMEAAAGTDTLVRELPIGRIEETRRGERFYFTGRLRSPDLVLDFVRKRPHLGIYNEKGELCDPEAVAGEIRGMKLGTAGAGGRTGSGLGAAYNDLSEWDR